MGSKFRRRKAKIKNFFSSYCCSVRFGSILDGTSQKLKQQYTNERDEGKRKQGNKTNDNPWLFNRPKFIFFFMLFISGIRLPKHHSEAFLFPSYYYVTQLRYFQIYVLIFRMFKTYELMTSRSGQNQKWKHEEKKKLLSEINCWDWPINHLFLFITNTKVGIFYLNWPTVRDWRESESENGTMDIGLEYIRHIYLFTRLRSLYSPTLIPKIPAHSKKCCSLAIVQLTAIYATATWQTIKFIWISWIRFWTNEIYFVYFA